MTHRDLDACLRQLVILGTLADGVRKVHSFKVGSGALAVEFL